MAKSIPKTATKINKKMIFVAIAVVVIALIATAVFLMIKNNDSATINNSKTTKSRSEIGDKMVERAKEAESMDQTKKAIRSYEQARRQYEIDSNTEKVAEMDAKLCSLGETEYCIVEQ